MCRVMSRSGGDLKTRSSHRKTVSGSAIMSDWLRRGSRFDEDDAEAGRRDRSETEKEAGGECSNREFRSPFTVITCKCLADG